MSQVLSQIQNSKYPKITYDSVTTHYNFVILSIIHMFHKFAII